MSPQRSPMERFARDYGDLPARSRFELQVSPGDSERRFAVDLLGVSRTPRYLLISAPANPDKSLIAVTKGQAMTCRWANATTVFRFRAVIANLAFEPRPLVYLGQLHAARRRTLRTLPRALAAISASVRTPAPHAALVTDLSVGGAQVGSSTDLNLHAGQAVELSFRPRVIGRDFVVTLACTVASVPGQADPRHPEIHFYGLNFLEPSEQDLLLLHACVQERLAQETDILTQMLLADSTEVGALE
ncbi:MAG: PilZ domain-containing protein [Steroidobacteraceae bacterium]